MAVDFKNLILFAIVAYVGYYIYSQSELIQDQQSIMEHQYNLIETQRAYIIEINRMLGINSQIYFHKTPQAEDSPINSIPL